MELSKRSLVRYEARTREITGDQRRKVAKIVTAYYDEAGNEYRRSYTGPAGTAAADLWRIAPEFIHISKL